MFDCYDIEFVVIFGVLCSKLCIGTYLLMIKNFTGVRNIMGVPALFRWLATKYPRIVESVVENNPIAEVNDEEINSKVSESVDIDKNCPSINLLEANPNGCEFDNLYLDMNGIIHPCTHPEGRPAPATEGAMMLEIFRYIDRIFAMIRPRRLIYFAIDGVAPRAKMNQQRARRFRAAQEAEQKRLQKEAEESLESDVDEESEDILTSERAFDSNCITPGTPFMDLVAKSLRWYIKKRMNEEPAWAQIRVLFSDASVPGEGEHKIVEYIRRQRVQTDYDPNLRHVIYGLDADLIMLSLATHEPRFRVLREDVFAGQNGCFKCGDPNHYADACPKKEPKAAVVSNVRKPFIFLDISMLREYLDAELGSILDNNGMKFNLERAIDDWIFLCFFVGNDFLPHLPCLEIREGAIDLLIDIYKAAWSSGRLQGWICEDGRVDLERAALIMSDLGKYEEIIFRKRREREERRIDRERSRKMRMRDEDDPREPASKQARTNVGFVRASQAVSSSASTPVVIHSVKDIPAALENKSLVEQRIKDRNRSAAVELKAQICNQEVPDELDPHDEVKLWEPGAKGRYYQAKFGIDVCDTETSVKAIDGIVKAYMEGLCWVMQYYYQGVPSWKWFYPYHYAPFASDVSDRVLKIPVNFDLGSPFRPFDQLMGVFPAASRQHIPEPFHTLMTDPDSPVIDFYPTDFRIDMNGKRQLWQGVALLPFIEEARLLKALEPLYDRLESEDRRRNEMGEVLLFLHQKYISPQNLAVDEFILVSFAEIGITGKLCEQSVSLIGAIIELEAEKEEYRVPDVTPISENQVHEYVYMLPEKVCHPYQTRLLDGVILSEPRLSPSERHIVASGQASRQFKSRLDVFRGGASMNGSYSSSYEQHHSMHREYQERYERQQNYRESPRRNEDFRMPQQAPFQEQQLNSSFSRFSGENRFAALDTHSSGSHYNNANLSIEELNRKYPPPAPNLYLQSMGFHRASTESRSDSRRTDSHSDRKR